MFFIVADVLWLKNKSLLSASVYISGGEKVEKEQSSFSFIIIITFYLTAIIFSVIMS